MFGVLPPNIDTLFQVLNVTVFLKIQNLNVWNCSRRQQFFLSFPKSVKWCVGKFSLPIYTLSINKLGEFLRVLRRFKSSFKNVLTCVKTLSYGECIHNIFYLRLRTRRMSESLTIGKCRVALAPLTLPTGLLSCHSIISFTRSTNVKSLPQWKTSFKKTVFMRGRVCWIWVWSTKVDMVCLSPVGYGV